VKNLFDLTDRVFVITGATGVLAGSAADYLAATIITNTPFGRFGNADELFGALHYLLADASQFVTGTVLAVDGGFVAFSGV